MHKFKAIRRLNEFGEHDDDLKEDFSDDHACSSVESDEVPDTRSWFVGCYRHPQYIDSENEDDELQEFLRTIRNPDHNE